MRRTSLLLCASALIAICGTAHAGDRYGAPDNSAAAARAPNWDGPLLNWSNKSDAANATAAVTPAEPTRPAPMSDWARHANNAPPSAPPSASGQPASRPAAAFAMPAAPAAQRPTLPSSLYDAPHAETIAAAAPPPKPQPDPYHPARSTGEVVSLSLADLPPPGPSLERQQAAEDDAQAMAAQIARANHQAVQDRADGKVSANTTTDLLGGPQ